MSTSTFSCLTPCRPRAGDLVLLPFADAATPLFAPGQWRGLLSSAPAAAEKPGRRMTLCPGRGGQADVLIHSVRLDEPDTPRSLQIKKMMAEALRTARQEGRRRVIVLHAGGDDAFALAAQEGALLGGYAFEAYCTEKKTRIPAGLGLPAEPGARLRRALAARAPLLAAVNRARDLINAPPNVCNPAMLAAEFRRWGRAAGLRVAVWDERRLARENCGGLLGVGQGARAKPRMVLGEYRPRAARGHLALVGKGITYDSGGYCLKPATSQVGMKYDMSGAALMFAAACVIARARLPLRVTVITPLAENAVSGEANYTTSIFRTRSGRTVEVHNTDAEGRLILADALALVFEKKPDWVIDAATLTGACVMALGEDIAGVFGTDPELTRALIDCGAAEDEWFWEMPLHAPYAEQLKTTIADCKNIGRGPGGAILGALFLKKWVPAKARWAHCDIAGPAVKEEPLGHLGRGAKGFGIKTLVRLAARLAQTGKP